MYSPAFLDDFVTLNDADAVGWIVLTGRIVGWWELSAADQKVRWTAFEPLPQWVLATVEDEAHAAYREALKEETTQAA